MTRAVVLVDHGSRRPEANAVLEAIGRLLQERLPDARVHVAHMELSPPSLAEAIGACVAGGAQEIVVHPYFLAPGSHSTRDIPALVAEALAARPDVRCRITEPLGVHPLLVEVVRDRIRAALDAGAPPGSLETDG